MIHEGLVGGFRSTKRDLYYRDPTLFGGSQTTVDRVRPFLLSILLQGWKRNAVTDEMNEFADHRPTRQCFRLEEGRLQHCAFLRSFCSRWSTGIQLTPHLVENWQYASPKGLFSTSLFDVHLEEDEGVISSNGTVRPLNLSSQKKKLTLKILSFALVYDHPSRGPHFAPRSSKPELGLGRRIDGPRYRPARGDLSDREGCENAPQLSLVVGKVLIQEWVFRRRFRRSFRADGQREKLC